MDGQLRKFREQKALSQRDLAQLSGVDASTIHRLEQRKSKARPSTIRKLAQSLGITPEQLMSEQGQFGP